MIFCHFSTLLSSTHNPYSWSSQNNYCEAVELPPEAGCVHWKPFSERDLKQKLSEKWAQGRGQEERTWSYLLLNTHELSHPVSSWKCHWEGPCSWNMWILRLTLTFWVYFSEEDYNHLVLLLMVVDFAILKLPPNICGFVKSWHGMIWSQDSFWALANLTIYFQITTKIWIDGRWENAVMQQSKTSSRRRGKNESDVVKTKQALRKLSFLNTMWSEFCFYFFIQKILT